MATWLAALDHPGRRKAPVALPDGSSRGNRLPDRHRMKKAGLIQEPSAGMACISTAGADRGILRMRPVPENSCRPAVAVFLSWINAAG